MIYTPKTEFGQKIASFLKYDDGVRLDFLEYLELIEPKLIEALEKAEKWAIFEDYVITEIHTSEGKLGFSKPTALKDLVEFKQKLEAIREIEKNWKDYDDIYPNTLIKIMEILGE